MPLTFMDIGQPIVPTTSIGPYITKPSVGDYVNGTAKTDVGGSNGSLTPSSSPMPYGDSIYDMDKWVEYLRNAAASGDSAALDKLVNYLASETSAKTARDWTEQREDTQYQRLMDDLKKAGISPYILSNAVPGASGARQNSYSGSQASDLQKTGMNNDTSIIGAIISILGSLLGGIIGKSIPNTTIIRKS